MKTTPQLDAHAKRAREYLESADQLDSEADDSRIKAGYELIAARRLVDAGETDLSWPAWCAHYVKRSDRDIRRVMALARADDPAQARENEKARNRAAKPPGSRATSPLQASIQRTGASPPVVPAREFDTMKSPSTRLRQAMEQRWRLLSRADQELFIDWCTDHMADPPISTVAQPHQASKTKQPPGGKVPTDTSIGQMSGNNVVQSVLGFSGWPVKVWFNNWEVARNSAKAVDASNDERQKFTISGFIAGNGAVVIGFSSKPWSGPTPFARVLIAGDSFEMAP